MSGVAALGTAVAEADTIVTYTPPPAATGTSDTVVYEIADVEDARDTGQIDITISDPLVAIATLTDQTFEVSVGALLIDITVTSPTEFAGNHTAALGVLSAGSINLVAPQITGTPTAGQVLTANTGLWIYDGGDTAPNQSFQWQRGGVDILGETGVTYTFQTSDTGPGIAVVGTQTGAGGAQSVTSASVGEFLPSFDTDLIGWWDASDTATITDMASAVSAWANKAAGPDLI